MSILYTVELSNGLYEPWLTLGVFSQWNKAFPFAEKQAAENNRQTDEVRLVEWKGGIEQTEVRRWEMGHEVPTVSED